jgi:hypothetical protein
MQAMFLLRNAVIAAAAAWAFFGIWSRIESGAGIDGLTQLGIVAWYVLIGSLLSLGAFVLVEIAQYARRQD